MHSRIASDVMARTTLNIDTPVLDELKRLGKRERKSLGRLVSELLTEALAGRHSEVAEGSSLTWFSKPMGARIDLEGKRRRPDRPSQGPGDLRAGGFLADLSPTQRRASGARQPGPRRPPRNAPAAARGGHPLHPRPGLLEVPRAPCPRPLCRLSEDGPPLPGDTTGNNSRPGTRPFRSDLAYCGGASENRDSADTSPNC